MLHASADCQAQEASETNEHHHHRRHAVPSSSATTARTVKSPGAAMEPVNTEIFEAGRTCSSQNNLRSSNLCRRIKVVIQNQGSKGRQVALAQTLSMAGKKLTGLVPGEVG